jgi:hypothetical protein
MRALFARLRLPNKLTIHANQTAGLQPLAHPLELLPRALSLAIKHALAVKLLAPGVELHDNNPDGQSEAGGRGLAAACCTFMIVRRWIGPSTGNTTRDVMGSPSASAPSSTRSSRETISVPSAKSLASSTVTITSPTAVRSTFSWLSTAPLRLVWPRGRLASIPQW